MKNNETGPFQLQVQDVVGGRLKETLYIMWVLMQKHETKGRCASTLSLLNGQ